MAKEREIKVLDINKKEVLAKLKKLHAKHQATYNFKRLVFLINKTGKKETWLRLRTDGKKHTLTFKDRTGRGISQTEEYETEVKDFFETARMLCRLFKNPSYFEDKRLEYRLKGATITINKWPMLPWFLEIEAKSDKAVTFTYELLNVNGKNAGNISAAEAYKIYGYDYSKIGAINSRRLQNLINSQK